jgi:hypothetical protein
VNTLLNSYFNLTHYKESKLYSLKRIIVGQADIKHTINNIIFNIYIFNKQKLFYLKRICMLNKITQNYFAKKNKSSFKNRKNNPFLKKIPYSFYKKIEMFLNKNNILKTNIIGLFTFNMNHTGMNNFRNIFEVYTYYNNQYFHNNIQYLYKGLRSNLEERIYLIYLYKTYTSKLYLNTFKFNKINLSYLSQILQNIYNKKIIIHITNVKYLHMDNSLFIDAIMRKLRDRNKRVLKVLRKAITLSKIPRIKPILLINANK